MKTIRLFILPLFLSSLFVMCTNKTESKSIDFKKADSANLSSENRQSDDWKKFHSINDTVEILKRLFDNCEIRQNDSSLIYDVHYSAIWKPNLNERLQHYPISDDGYCHTFMDTIMYYKTVEHLRKEIVTEYAVIIFDHINIDMQGCHACHPTLGLALFFKDKNGMWEILDFNKRFIESGERDERGQLSIVDFGNNLFCLSEKSFGGNMGEYSGGIAYYDLYNNLSQIFSYCYVYDSDGGIDSNGKNFEHSESELIITPIKNDYSILELRTKKSEKGNTVVEKYKYSTKLKAYELVKN